MIKCPGTGRFVLWAKGFTPVDNTSKWSNAKLAVVATAGSPLGPFELANPRQTFYPPGGTAMADATLHVDSRSGAGRAWLYWRSVTPLPGQAKGGFYGAMLSQDCTALADDSMDSIVRIADIEHEAPAVFEAGGKLYIWTSSTTGFRANPAKLLVSENGAPTVPLTAV
eukprot:SAG22_NODE_2989_length_2045_cov_2.700411_2_plen_168_part_00